MKENLRKYGKTPFSIAVIHGGPGAPGEMAPVARELAGVTGVLEPLQTEPSLEGQVQELLATLSENGEPPVTLIGWSWGALLSFILASEHPSLVKKLILVASPPLEEEYAAGLIKTRLERLSERHAAQVLSLTEALDDPDTADKDRLFSLLGKLMSRADSYDPLPQRNEALECRYDIYHSVWERARELRASGRLLELGKKIGCPVVAVHGDYDPHPARGVKEPLSRVLKDFRFRLLKNCGHKPWVEKAARDSFYAMLRTEILSP